MLDILSYIMINQCKISALASIFFGFDNIMLPSPLWWINQWAVEFADFQFVLFASIVYRMKSNNPPGPSRRLQTRNHAQPLARSRPPPPLLPHTDMQKFAKFDKFSQLLYKLQKMLQTRNHAQPLTP